MTVLSAFPILYAADVEAALAFYRGALGLEVGYAWPPEGAPEFVVVRAGETSLGIASASAPRDLLGLEVGDRPRFELCLYVDDVDETIAHLRALGVRVLREPEEMPWGERMAYVADPDGNPVQIAARAE